MKTAQELFDRAFDANRKPRSDEYMKGAYEAFKYRAGEISLDEIKCPYPEATAQADAWNAGVSEGITAVFMY